ncbi:MAG TPA: hypothetical protein PLL10_03430 [Elusimicrobiales bacterium]|nr:hypothetical protein [Elusimicrobiales bacterium]
MKRNLFRLVAVILALAVAGELLTRIVGADARLMRPLLRYNEAYELPVYRQSSDPELVYELAPLLKTDLENRGSIRINSLGFRDTERLAEKPAGVTRIICLGGDFTYGSEVNDAETYPSRLEQLLNKNYAGRFEVWNAGIRNGNLSYQTALARKISKFYGPDLLLFQTGDTGSRVFLKDSDLPYYFSRNKQLYTENLRFLPFPDSSLSAALFDFSALYRLAVVFLNNCLLINKNNPLFYLNGRDKDVFNFLQLAKLFADNPAQPKLVLANADFKIIYPGSLSEIAGQIDPLLVDCFSEGKLPPKASDEYLLKRPPAHVLNWYAGCLAKELEKRGHIREKNARWQPVQ